MAATIRFDIGDTGTENQSRSDAALSGAVSVVNVVPGDTNTLELLSRPVGSTASVGGATPTFSITPDVVGSYRLKLTADAGDSVIHTLTVKTAVLGLHIPAHNERASEEATVADTAYVAESETNEGADAETQQKGWAKPMEENLLSIEADAVVNADHRASQDDYLLRDGTLPMTGGLDMDDNNLDNVGNITGTDVDISAGTGDISTTGFGRLDGGLGIGQDPTDLVNIIGAGNTEFSNVTRMVLDTNNAVALLVEQDGVKDNVLVVDTTTGRVGINASPAVALAVSGGNIRSVRTETSDHTVLDTDYVILADATSNTVTITLPASPNQGQIFNVKCINATFTCTLARNGNNIDGAAVDKTLVLNESLTVQYDATYGWGII